MGTATYIDFLFTFFVGLAKIFFFARHNFFSEVQAKMREIKNILKFCYKIEYEPSLQWSQALEHCSPSLLRRTGERDILGSGPFENSDHI